MSNEMILPMLNEQCEVSQTSMVYNAYDIYLDEEIKDPTYYRHAFQVLRSAQQGDLVRIYISSPGGNLNSALIFRNRIQECQGDVVAIIEAEAYSAASLIALSCPSIEVKPYATMMLHNAAFGSSGSVQNVRDHVEFTGRHAESLMEEVYKDFISAEELLDLKKGRELWFDYKEIGERLDKMFKSGGSCCDPNCEGCSEDFDCEPEFNLIELIEHKTEDAVTKALDKILKKYNLVEKEKPARKAPAKKSADKVVDNASPEA